MKNYLSFSFAISHPISLLFYLFIYFLHFLAVKRIPGFIHHYPFSVFIFCNLSPAGAHVVFVLDFTVGILASCFSPWQANLTLRALAQWAHWHLHPGRYLAAKFNFKLSIAEPSVPLLTHTALPKCVKLNCTRMQKNVCRVLAQGLYEGADYCGHQGEKSWQVWKSPLWVGFNWLVNPLVKLLVQTNCTESFSHQQLEA